MDPIVTDNGSDNADTLTGGNNNDDLRSGKSDDIINAGGGDDNLDGGPDNDTLNGGPDNDTLRGGTGSDVSNGGTGDDIFVYSPGDVGENEHIGDYEFGEWINIGVLGPLGPPHNGLPTDSQVRMRPEPGGTALDLDLDGDGAFDVTIHLDGVRGGKAVLQPQGGVRIYEERNGTAANDLIPADGAAFFADGGGGFDTLNLNVNFGSVDITHGSGQYFIDGQVFGHIALEGIELVTFEDGGLRLDIDGNAGQAFRLYQAAFGRIPDTEGLTYWIHELDAGRGDATWMALSFIESEEFIERYGTSESVNNFEFLSLLYANILDRDPDSGGFAYWEAELERGFARESALASFSESVENKQLTEISTEEGIWIL